MKVNRYGRASILSPTQITLLFNEGFTKPRDRALFGVCLYGAARINEACTLLGLEGAFEQKGAVIEKISSESLV